MVGVALMQTIFVLGVGFEPEVRVGLGLGEVLTVYVVDVGLMLN